MIKYCTGSPDAIRGIVIGLVLMTANQFTGPFTLATYAATIFQETGSTIDPGMSSIIMGITQLVGTIFASSLIDRVGRKLLLLISAAGTALALLMTGAYCYLNAHGFDVSAFNMLPVVTLSAFIFLSAIGLNPVPYVVTAESLPPKVGRLYINFCTFDIHIFVLFSFFQDSSDRYDSLRLQHQCCSLHNAPIFPGGDEHNWSTRMHVLLCDS